LSFVEAVVGYYSESGPASPTRHRVGAMEKCDFCRERVEGGGEPECVASCTGFARFFGDLDDPASEAARLARAPGSFRLLERLGTGAKVYYHTERDWVRRQAAGRTAAGDGRTHG
jgi:molybdopterin-containing oxidoreductase family iron-sulfur binding subunit